MNSIQVGRPLSSRVNVRRDSWHIQRQSHRPLREPAQRRARCRRTIRTSAPGLVGAPACGDVMKLQLKISDDGHHRGREVQDVRLRLGDRSSSLATEWLKGKTVDEANAIKNTRHRQGAQPAAGEDPLLGPRRGRDQGGDRRLQEEAGASDRGAVGDNAKRAAGRVTRIRSAKEGRGSPARGQARGPAAGGWRAAWGGGGFGGCDTLFGEREAPPGDQSCRPPGRRILSTRGRGCWTAPGPSSIPARTGCGYGLY